MGGELFLGIRRSDGREQCSLRWTNIMPYFFAHPDMYEEGPMFEELWNRPRIDNKWPESVLINKVVPSEYGIILFDGVTKEILNMQGYCSIGKYSVSVLQAGTHALFATMIEHDRILGSEILKDGHFIFIDKPTTLKEVKLWIQNEASHPPQYCQLIVDTRPYSVINHLEAKENWEFVVNWLEARNWKSSAMDWLIQAIIE